MHPMGKICLARLKKLSLMSTVLVIVFQFAAVEQLVFAQAGTKCLSLNLTFSPTDNGEG